MSATDEMMRTAEHALANRGGTTARDPSPDTTAGHDPEACADDIGHSATPGDPAADTTGRS